MYYATYEDVQYLSIVLLTVVTVPVECWICYPLKCSKPHVEIPIEICTAVPTSLFSVQKHLYIFCTAVLLYLYVLYSGILLYFLYSGTSVCSVQENSR